MNGQAICEDCGNGTLNNELNEQFDFAENEDGNKVYYCMLCGSRHVDGQLERSE